MSDYIQVVTTTEIKEDAARIAKEMITKRLAACAQVLGPIQSTYRWKGDLESSEEWLCLMKSRKDLFPKIETAIKDIHPYEVPEIIVVPILTGHQPYLKWMEEELGNGD